MDSSHAVQLTFALTAGLGCGILIGALLASRRRAARPSSANVVSWQSNIICSSWLSLNENIAFPHIVNFGQYLIDLGTTSYTRVSIVTQ